MIPLRTTAKEWAAILKPRLGPRARVSVLTATIMTQVPANQKTACGWLLHFTAQAFPEVRDIDVDPAGGELRLWFDDAVTAVAFKLTHF